MEEEAKDNGKKESEQDLPSSHPCIGAAVGRPRKGASEETNGAEKNLSNKRGG